MSSRLHEFTDALADQWAALELFRFDQLEALASVLQRFEVMAATGAFRGDIRHLVAPSRLLNRAVIGLMTRCPASRPTSVTIEHAAVKRPGVRRELDRHVGEALGLAHIDAIAGYLRAFDDLEGGGGVICRSLGKRSIHCSIGPGESARRYQEVEIARRSWDEFLFERYEECLRLVLDSSLDPMTVGRMVHGWQTDAWRLPDSLHVGCGFVVREWSPVLLELDVRAVKAMRSQPRKYAAILAARRDRLIQSIAAQTGIRSHTVGQVLADLTLDATDKGANLAETPLVAVGDWLLTSPTILLLRRADSSLLRRWLRLYGSTFRHQEVAKGIHNDLAERFKALGWTAFADLQYKSTRGQGDVDVLVGDNEGGWVVLQVKGFLAPTPGSQSIQEQRAHFLKGQRQVAEAVEILKTEPRALLRTGASASRVKTVEGLIAATHLVGADAAAGCPIVEIGVLRDVLRRNPPPSGLSELVGLARHRSRLQLPLSASIALSREAVIEYPYVYGRTRWEARLNALITHLLFHLLAIRRWLR